MGKLLFLLIFFSLVVEAKTINIIDIWGRQAPYTVDNQLPVWKFVHYVIRENGLSVDEYTIGRDSRYGFDELKHEETVGKYGQDPEAAVLFYILKKGQPAK